MAENVGTIYYTVEADTGRLLDSSSQLDKSLLAAENRMRQTDRAADQLTTGMNKLASAIKLVIAASAIREMARMVQSYQAMSERVQMATDSQQEFELVQQRLLKTANGTYRALSEAQELYIRTADSLRAMGYSTAQAMDVQDSMSYAFVKNATSADRADAAISAFSKSVNTGKVAADQWETILTAVPSVIDDIAAASGKSAAEVRALGAAGKLAATDLTEGLRKSLDENAQAAAKMANDLTDASVRVKIGITAVLAGLEEQTGALETLTSSLIQAADAMLQFGGDGKQLAQLIDAAAIAGSALAAVIAGRMITAMLGYVTAQGQAIAGTVARIRADQEAAQAALRRAAADKAAGMQALATAKADFEAARGTSAHAHAQAALSVARQRAVTVVDAYAAAQVRANAVASAGTVIMARLNAVMTFLGGKAGILLLAASAVMSFGNRSSEAAEKVQDLVTRSRELGKTLDQISMKQVQSDIADTERELNKLAKALVVEKVAIGGGDLTKTKKQYDDLSEALQNYRNEESRLRYGQQQGAEPVADDPVLKNFGSGKEKDDKAKKAAEERDRLIKENAKTIADLKQQMEFAALAGEELAVAQAKASLNKAATPQDVAEVTRLASALWKLDEVERKRAQFGDDPTKAIVGNVAPLSGGQFDDQTARYEAEAQAEQQRYADQLKRLQDAKALQIEVTGGYLALEEQMYRDHSDRMAQIEQAKSDVMMSQAASAFGDMATNLQDYVNTFGSENKAMLGMIKAAAIAQTIIQTYQGAQAAYTALAGIPVVGPGLGAAAAAAAVAGGLARVAAIRSQSAGGRQYGGPVVASKMYRVNENGRPEVFQAANGQQYMLPNRRGEVVSNKDASGQGGTVVNLQVSLIKDAARDGQASMRQASDGRLAVDMFVADLRSDGPASRTMQATFGLRRQGK